MILASEWKGPTADALAVVDRGTAASFVPPPPEVHGYTAGWSWDQEVYDWVAERLHPRRTGSDVRR
ncbi:MAG TPA: hypothetical protein VFE78_33625 [Gemmataceae bacterium]|nr:hypothetical protein [Gemmataceae bacterium]